MEIGIFPEPMNIYRWKRCTDQIPRMEQVLRETFDALGKDIVLAHAKDFTGDMTFTAAGEGRLDFPLYIRLLKQSGYHGARILHGLAENRLKKAWYF